METATSAGSWLGLIALALTGIFELVRRRDNLRHEEAAATRKAKVESLEDLVTNNVKEITTLKEQQEECLTSHQECKDENDKIKDENGKIKEEIKKCQDAHKEADTERERMKKDIEDLKTVVHHTTPTETKSPFQ